MSNPEMRRPGAATPGHQNAKTRQGVRVCHDDSASAPADQFGVVEPYELYDAAAADTRGLSVELATIIERGWPVVFTPNLNDRRSWTAAVKINGRTVQEYATYRNWAEALEWCERLARNVPNSRVVP